MHDAASVPRHCAWRRHGHKVARVPHRHWSKLMNRIVSAALSSVALLLLCGGAAGAAERGTPAEAKAMLAKAAAHYQSVGREQALADFNSRKAPFGDRDLYVFCLSPERKIVANGGFPSLVGGLPDVFKDSEGKPVAKAMWDVVANNG